MLFLSIIETLLGTGSKQRLLIDWRKGFIDKINNELRSGGFC